MWTQARFMNKTIFLLQISLYLFQNKSSNQEHLRTKQKLFNIHEVHISYLLPKLWRPLRKRPSFQSLTNEKRYLEKSNHIPRVHINPNLSS